MTNETEEDTDLPHKLTQPWMVDLDDDSYCVNYAFGPQGHPASVRISIVSFRDSDIFNFKIWFISSLITNYNTKEIPFSPLFLKKCLLYGDSVNKRFGHDPFWHVCKKGCQGWTYDGGPPYKRCNNCEQVRITAEADTKAWLRECEANGTLPV